MNILQTSYEGLDEQEKAAFLHVACLFNGNSVQRVNALIDDGDIRTKALEAKSLIDISPDGCITMHVLIEQAARAIVRKESGSMPWRQRILWKADRIISVLQRNTGTTTSEGVALHMCDMLHTLSIEGNVLNAINNLKFFKAFTHLNDIESKLKFLPGTDMLPNTLRLLHWDSYPMTTLPPKYYPHCLVELNLRYSNLVRLWDGTLGLSQLRRLDVTGSKNLTEIPDLSSATLLKELIMRGCTGLEQTPESIGSLSCLQKLDLSNCDGLTNLQIHITEKTVLGEPGLRRRRQIILRLPRAVKKKLSSLENLSIEGQIYIRLWHLRGNAEHLSYISEEQIPKEYMVIPKERLPFITSFYDLKSLSIKRFSYIADCTPFNCISFSRFPCLAELNLINLNIQRIPDDIGLLQSLEKLDLSGNDFRNLPTSMKNLSKLKYAKLSNCSQLETLPELTDLHTLKLSGCSNLESLLELTEAVQDVGRFRLLELELDNSKIVQPQADQLSHFTNLIHLDLSNHDFEAIPKSIIDLLSLGTLCLNNCKKLKSVEELPQSLKHLYAHGCNSLENVNLSPNHSIKHLDLSHCFRLQQDEQLITRFLKAKYSQEISQRFVCLPGTGVPRFFYNQSHGTSTQISLPPIRFTPTLLGFAACIVISCERSFNLQFPTFSYDWNCEADEVIRINLKPNLNLSSMIEEEETVTSHHLVIIHVPSSINTEKIEELRLESDLHLPEELQFPHGEIRACGIRMIDDDYSN
ncbi:Disease resistance-like protein DSC2 [Cardamine amara subsp. amara]|uniref:Disease resistance-like protein DSC2 n=1 Tax=Cardamine amara subsp. amara TaxID=228776 RepID=A0ABD1BKD6_CARAN